MAREDIGKKLLDAQEWFASGVREPAYQPAVVKIYLDQLAYIVNNNPPEERTPAYLHVIAYTLVDILHVLLRVERGRT